MLLTKEVEVCLGSRNIKYYESLGYEIPRVIGANKQLVVAKGTTITVRIEDLQSYSRVMVDVLCDACKINVSHIRYSDYTNYSSDGFHYCTQCANVRREHTCTERYGCRNVFQSPDIKAKSSKTMIEKYGADNNLKIPEIREKIKQTCLSRYGVEHISQNKEIMQKAKESAMLTMCANGNCPTSSQQLIIFNMLKSHYGENNVLLNVPCGTCALDVVVKFEYTCINIEYDGAFWHKDQQKDRRRDEFVKTQGYKVLRIKSGKMIPELTDLVDKIERLKNGKHTYGEIVLSDWKTIQNDYNDNQIDIEDESHDITNIIF